VATNSLDLPSFYDSWGNFALPHDAPFTMATILEYNSKTFTGTGESGATLAKGLLKGPKPDKNEIHDKVIKCLHSLPQYLVLTALQRTNGGTKAENSAKAVKMHIHGDVIQSSLVGRHVQTETLEFSE